MLNHDAVMCKVSDEKNKTKLRIAQTNKRTGAVKLETQPYRAGIRKLTIAEISGRISTRPSSISADVERFAKL